MDLQEALESQEEAQRVYNEDKTFRKYADRRHRGHCDVDEPLQCIEQDNFLVRMLETWDEDGYDL